MIANQRVCWGADSIGASWAMLLWIAEYWESIEVEGWDTNGMRKDLGPRLDEVVLDALESRAVQFLTINGGRAGVFVNAYPPRFQDSVLDQWVFRLETCSDEALHVYRRCKQDPAVLFALVAIDDFPDMEVARVTRENFPWDFFLLRIGGVRDAAGAWSERIGSSSDGAELTD